MKKIVKRIGIVLGGILGIAAIFVLVMVIKTKVALDNQENVPIDMQQVADGTYTGSSDGGLVQVEVEVEVKDHKIVSIDLLKHENGKGKPAEAILDDMIKDNTYDVDTVSGATTSSKTIINAVNNALRGE